MFEARPLAGYARLLIVDVVVGFAVSIQLCPRLTRVTGLLAEVQGVLIEGCAVDAKNSAVRQFVEVNVDTFKERLVTVSELTEVNELGNNVSFGDLATDFGLHPDSVHDDAPFCFWESRGERILLSVIIGAPSDAPDT